MLTHALKRKQQYDVTCTLASRVLKEMARSLCSEATFATAVVTCETGERSWSLYCEEGEDLDEEDAGHDKEAST